MDYSDNKKSVCGAQELYDKMSKWETLSKNINDTKAEKLIILPDMLWVTTRGINKKHLLSDLAECLDKLKNLMPFEGNDRFIDFYLGYPSSNSIEIFPEFARFIDTVDTAKGYNQEYKGIVCIDINEWIPHLYDPRFISFLEYLATNTDNWLIIFNIVSESEQQTEKIESLLALYMRIERIQFSVPLTKDLVNSAVSMLSDYGFTLDKSCRSLLEDSIEKIRGSKYFDGFPSITRICEDIIYGKLSTDSDNMFNLSAADLKDFSADSDYINRLISNYFEREKHIGFGEV